MLEREDKSSELGAFAQRFIADYILPMRLRLAAISSSLRGNVDGIRNPQCVCLYFHSCARLARKE